MRQQIRNLTLALVFASIAFGGMGYIAWKRQYLNKMLDLVQANQASSDGTYYKVKTVYDGDTIAVDMMGTTEKVRLIGVDTPETHDPDVPVQCYGPEASNFSEINLLGKEVRLETDDQNQNRDRYERLLRYVYLRDGRLWNKVLIDEGYGFAYLRFPFTKLSTFRDSETIASINKKGLWSACSPTIIKGVYQTNSATTE
jgi:endonuclease YncB( thermonuclease family)